MKLAGGTLSSLRPKSTSSHHRSPGVACRSHSWKKAMGSPMAALSHLPRGRTSLDARTTLGPSSSERRTVRQPSSWFLISCSQASPVSSAKAPPGNTTESRKFAAVTWRLSARRKSGASWATAHCVMPR